MQYEQNMVSGRTKDEVAPTDEMIEAGFRVLCNSGIADDYLEADKLLVEEIYRAMSSKSPHSPSRPA